MEQRNRTYYHDARKNYLVLTCNEGADTRNAYQYRMITSNRIEGLLSCSIRQIDEKTYLYYDVTGKRTLSSLRQGAMNGDLAKKLLSEAVRAQNGLSRYLLDRECMQLLPDLVFYDLSKEHFVFVYDPGHPAGNGWQALFSYLRESLSGRDKQATRALLTLSEMVQDDNTVLREADLQRAFEGGAGQMPDRSSFEWEEEIPRTEQTKKPAQTQWAGEDPFGVPADPTDPCRSCKKKDWTACSERPEGQSQNQGQALNNSRPKKAVKAAQEPKEKEEVPKDRVKTRKRSATLFLALAFLLALAQKILPVQESQRRSFLVVAALLFLAALVLFIAASIEEKKTKTEAGKEAAKAS